ncbi:MAG: DsbA family protein [Halolamina sp.]
MFTLPAESPRQRTSRRSRGVDAATDGPLSAAADWTPSRRALLFGAGGAVAAGAAGALGTGAFGDDRDDGDGDAAGDPVSTAPTPPTPGDHRYATMGTGDAGLTVTYFGNWKCPHCAEFSAGFLQTLLTEYVVTGEVAVQFRNLTWTDGEPFLGADGPAAARAGLAVWNVDPGSYWAYHELVMGDQPPPEQTWATADHLVALAEEAGVSDPEIVRAAIEEGAYEERLRATTDAASAAGIRGVPMLVVGDTVVSPFAEESVRKAIDRRLN